MRRDSHMRTQRRLQAVRPIESYFGLFMISFCKIRTARYIRPVAVRAELTIVAASGVPYNRERFRYDGSYRGVIVQRIAARLQSNVPDTSPRVLFT